MENHRHFIPDFSVYGDQPKVIAIAFKTRIEIQADRNTQKQSMKRRTAHAGVVRSSGRVDVAEPDAWNRLRSTKKCRSWYSAAPRSPSDHWLACHGYQKFPF